MEGIFGKTRQPSLKQIPGFPQPGSLLTINGEFKVIGGEMQILEGLTKNGPDKSRAVYYQDWSIICQEIL